MFLHVNRHHRKSYASDAVGLAWGSTVPPIAPFPGKLAHVSNPGDTPVKQLFVLPIRPLSNY